jgi:uncharacterized OB-fold protein
VSGAEPYAKPRPSGDGPNGAFYRHLAETRELAFQRCDACGTLRHPPRVQCASCGSDASSFAPSSGRGRVHTWTVTHQALVPAFAREVPYAVVVTELEEGVRLVSGTRAMTPEMLAIDLPVEVILEEVADGLVLPFVRPRSDGTRS